MNQLQKHFANLGSMLIFDEKTSEKDFKKKIDSWNKFRNKTDVSKELLRLNIKQVKQFFNSLERSVSRFIERIFILPLHGQESVLTSITGAIDFLKNYNEYEPKANLVKYEIIIKYNTGDRIEASFKDKKDTINFLESYL